MTRVARSLQGTALAVCAAVGLLVACTSDDSSAPTSPTSSEGPPSEPRVDVARTTTSPPPDVAHGGLPCPSLLIERSFAHVEDPGLVEISGAAASHQSPGVIWVHQDSGHPAVITALGHDGATVGRWSMSGVEPWDWEDMALAHDSHGSPWLFVGDIGDNRATRTEVEVIRVPEPMDPEGGGTIDTVEQLVLRSPIEPTDAEALMVDPSTGDLVVLTKSIDGLAEILVASGGAWSPDGSTLELRHAGSLRLGLFQAVLAADVSADGSVVVVRTPTSVRWWQRDPGQTLAETMLEKDSCPMPAVFDPLGEAIALLPDGGYLLVGEGRHASMHRAR